MLALFLATVILALNAVGKRLERHAESLRLLDLRLTKLSRIQGRSGSRLPSVRPPPLSEARTIEIDVELLRTLKLELQGERECRTT